MRTSLTVACGVLATLTGCGSDPVCTQEANPAVAAVNRQQGYLDWKIDGLLVPRDTCGVEAMNLTANLQRSE